MPTHYHFLYATNIISRANQTPEQELNFYFKVQLGQPAPEIEVHWAGEAGIWQTTPAAYHAAAEAGWSLWRAGATVRLAAGALPGNVQFACSYRVNDVTEWENAQGQNYRLEADAGLWASVQATDLPLNLDHGLSRLPRQRRLTFNIAVHEPTLKPERVFVRWTRDGWRTTQEAALTRAHDFWEGATQSNARNPNQYGWGVWQGQIGLARTQRVEYSVGCVTPTGTIWDNNHGANYAVQGPVLKVLTLNLHCYQEENQAAKFAQIVKAMREQSIDVACLQEVAEPWNNGAGDWAAHAGHILQEQLGPGYALYSDWAHIGFDRYREGVAVLSRWPLLAQASTYLSETHDPRSIHTRKAVLGQIDTPLGRINMIATHLSWWEDGFQTQFETLHRWAKEHHTPEVVATLIGGDFNIPRNGPGFAYIHGLGEFVDTFNTAAKTDDEGRIDYIWQMGAGLKATGARTLFTAADYGRVSDHLGYCVTFGPPQAGGRG